MGESKQESGLRIVIVEDEDALRTMYKLKLEMEHYTVLEASNGQAGLDLVRKEKPDLVLLDILMPGMGGFEVLETLKKDTDPAISSIPVVLLTNLAEDAGYEQGLALGAAAYCMKVTHTPDRLVQLIRAMVKTDKK